MDDDRKYLEKNLSYQLLKGRLGLSSSPNFTPNTVTGVNDLAHYLRDNGGYRQQERMIKDKRRTLDKALLYSYQSAFIKKISEEKVESIRALINPNKVKQDYDDKIVSVGYEYDLGPGDIFKWENTGTYWLIYLQDLTELAYFRGDIRKCRYKINWIDEENVEHSTYAAIRGPVETKIVTVQKSGVNFDVPNLSLNILMPKNLNTIKAFKRYSRFFLSDLEFADDPVVWQVETSDSVSMPGVLAINATEYYYNPDEDNADKGIVGGLVVKPIDPNDEETNDSIVGATFIKPKKEYEYKFAGSLISDWKISSQAPVQLTEVDEYTVKVKWLSTLSGQFDITYGSFTKTIVVESLF